jgi:hypothetical protein
MNPSPYRAAWDDYRWRAWRFWAAIVLDSPVVGILSFFVNFIVIHDALFLAIWIGAWIARIVPTDRSVMSFPCPRCSKPFFRGDSFTNGFARRRMRCKLRKWALYVTT